MSKVLRIGILAPPSISLVNGGVRTQVSQTAKSLQRLGHEIVWIQSNEPFPSIDILHVFVASSEHWGLLRQLKSSPQLSGKDRMPIVLSPIFFAPKHIQTTKFKLHAESVVGKFFTGISSEYGIKKQICQLADIILPNTRAEQNQINQLFDIPIERLQVIPNGVESRFMQTKSDEFEQRYGLKDFVLFVGQASSTRKNILSLLEIAPSLDAPLVVIGDLAKDAYSLKCLDSIKEHNIVHLPTLEHHSSLLASAYTAAKVFVLPSLFETPGIAAMEAALSGCAIVITQNGGTKEYFKDMASYINPIDTNQLRATINELLNTDGAQLEAQNAQLKDHIITHYSWDTVGTLSLAAYESLLR
jgi:glycosyltransferase involved in cell wall biosynthesis